MKELKKYHGVIAPIVTPVSESGKIDDGAVERLLDFILASKNIPFILVTTGEIASNSFASRDHLAQLTGKITSGKTILYAGITDNCIENTVNTAKKYADWGIDIFVVHLPFFFPLTRDLMLHYFENVAKHSPRPIMIYNIPSVTHMSVPIDVIDELSHHPNIVGLKDSERDYERIEKLTLLFRYRKDFSLFIGWTNKASQALLSGFDGIIPNTSNVIPGLFQSLYEAAINGDDKEALRLQNIAEGLSQLVQNNKTMTQTIPAIKCILDHLNICKPYVLPPLIQLSDIEKAALLKAYSSLNFQ